MGTRLEAISPNDEVAYILAIPVPSQTACYCGRQCLERWGALAVGELVVGELVVGEATPMPHIGGCLRITYS